MCDAGAEEAEVVGEVVVDGGTIDAGSVGDRADARPGRANAGVELDGCRRDPAAGLVHLLGAASQRVLASLTHSLSTTVESNLTERPRSLIHPHACRVKGGFPCLPLTRTRRSCAAISKPLMTTTRAIGMF